MTRFRLQPDPMPGERAVAPVLFNHLRSYCTAPREREILPVLIGRLEARVNVGKAKYGTVLQTFNGRDALCDAWEETADQVFYLKQAQMEGKYVEGVLRTSIAMLIELTWMLAEAPSEPGG